MEVLQRHVLVLNRHWLAVHICSVRRALSMLYQELAQVVTGDYQTHDFRSWCDSPISPSNGSGNGNGNGSELLIRSPGLSLRVPQVIVLRRYNRNPPRTVRFNRRNIYLRDRHQCQYCRSAPSHDELTIDHVIPRSRGGRSDWSNVVTACAPCNAKKGNRLPAECGMYPSASPRRPSWMATLRHGPRVGEVVAWKPFIDSKHWLSNAGR